MRVPRSLVQSALICIICGAILSPASAAKSRDELLFQLNAAILAGDRAAFARCFNFAGADVPTRGSFVKIIDQIFAWPTHHLFATDRKGGDDPRIEQGGKFYRLNGDWKFQVHIFLSNKTSKGFVFPAGAARGQTLVLVAVPETRP